MDSKKTKALAGSKIALIGCGDIGNRVAALLLSQDAQVWGYRRQADNIIEGVHAVALDIHDEQQLKVLQQQDFDYVLISLTPGVSAKNSDQAAVAKAYKQTYVEGLSQVLNYLNTDALKKLIWVSSTSVYAQDDNAWVDETSPTEPQRVSGQCILQAEQLLVPLQDKACVVRFAGIYRDGRHRMLTQLQQGKLCAKVDRDYYTNRIHVQDCARMIVFLMAQAAQGKAIEQLYVGVDDTPVLYTELVAFLSATTGLPLNTIDQARKPAVGSKRCSNRRIRALGFEFEYANYQAGFSALIKAMH